MPDPLAALARIEGVSDACAAALQEVDALLWDRSVRARAAEVAVASAMIGARDTAALDGADVPLEQLRSGAAIDDSPMGRVLSAAVRLLGEVPRQVDTWSAAPLQALAALHLVTAREFSGDDAIGRPRGDAGADDPLRIGQPPPAADVPPRLNALARLVTTPTRAPALVVAGVVHGELLALRPFAWGSGMVARAAVRLVMAGRGVDPDLLSAPEAGMVAQGRSSYVQALRDYASGTPEGVGRWLVWHATAVAVGARAVRSGER